jgi:type IV pilus assembly protein PilA
MPARVPGTQGTSAQRLVLTLHRAHDERKSPGEIEGAEAGFTLVELLIVLLIMAILLAMAVPTFLGVKGGAQDRAIQSNLTNALISAKVAYANSVSFGTTPALEVQSLRSAEPNLTFNLATLEPAKGTNALSVDTSADGQQMLMVGYSASGECWAVEDNEGVAAGHALTNAGSYTLQGVYYTSWRESAGACDDTGLVASTPTWIPTGYPSTA